MKSNLLNQNIIKRPWLLCVLALTLLISFIYRDKSEFELCLDKAESGDSNAQYIVGLMYFNGEGVEINFHNALQWFQKASKQENVKAQYAVGVMYYNGNGVTKDLAKAEEWFQKAAEQDYANAQYNIGEMHYNGEGVTKDFAEAMKWFQKAAEQGNPNAQYNIGVMYYRGESIKKDYDIAAEWFQKAADQGFAKAEEVLNVINKEAGVIPMPKDELNASKWTLNLIELDYASFQIDLDSVREQLTAGLDVNSIDEKGISLLHKAVIIGNIDLVKLLVENGADLDIELKRVNSNHMRLTPILYAVIQNKKNIVSYLINQGVDVDKKLNSNTTILHHASAHNHVDLVQLIISKDADINSCDTNGMSPLHYASNIGNKKIIEILIEAGANVNAKEGKHTPLDLVLDKSLFEITALLRKHGGKTAEELKAAGN